MLHGRLLQSGARPANSRVGRPFAAASSRPIGASAVLGVSAGQRRRLLAVLARAGLLTDADLEHLRQAAQLADSSAGVTQPHPNAGCVLVASNSSQVVGSAYQRAQGSASAEVQALLQAGEAANGATAYLNLETGDCDGDDTAVAALLQAKVARVVCGLRHPLPHLRGRAIEALRRHGVTVDVLGEPAASTGTAGVHLPGTTSSSSSSSSSAAASAAESTDTADATLHACLAVNEALLHRAALRRPLSILKYAMTLDGKIATNIGHSAWVSSSASRAYVFECRARSDAVIVGGNTVRRDNPRLTTRRVGGHSPVRVVMSRTLDLPEDANLWDVSIAPTIVMTQRGARSDFQKRLAARGVEVVEFDFLTPDHVAAYCYERGFLQVFWECGGTLAAPAIAAGVVHKVLAFIAPKIIGGTRAPTPVGELGFVEMTQAVELLDTTWQPVGPDLMVTGYLPSSGGLLSLEGALSYPGRRRPPGATAAAVAAAAAATAAANGGVASGAAGSNGVMGGFGAQRQHQQQQQRNRPGGPPVVSFYKAWDKWGALSNFSPHAIDMPDFDAGGSSERASSGATATSSGSGNGASSTSGGSGGSSSGSSSSRTRRWSSVEHYYQASKFAGVQNPEAKTLIADIAAAPSPEEAARLGRRAERERPELLNPDWGEAKRGVMLGALRAKFGAHAGPRRMLLETGAADIVEGSPHDVFWGQGFYGNGQNELGRLLVQVRGELRQDGEAGQQQQQQQQGGQVQQGREIAGGAARS